MKRDEVAERESLALDSAHSARGANPQHHQRTITVLPPS
jgi:hypothetical protein